MNPIITTEPETTLIPKHGDTYTLVLPEGVEDPHGLAGPWRFCGTCDGWVRDKDFEKVHTDQWGDEP